MMAKYPALTSLRFFAAWTVVAYHAADQGKLPNQWLDWSLPVQAVSVFFVLSGFVLQRAYGGDLRGASPPAFLARRIARVWPLHAAVAIVLLGVMPAHALTGSIARVLTLTHAWSADIQIFSWEPNAPTWSLSVELFFYILFPFITNSVRRNPAGTAMAALLWLVAYIALRAPADQTARFGAFLAYPLGRLPEFLLGMCAAECLPAVTRVPLPRWGWTFLEGTALASVVGLDVAIPVALPWIARVCGLNAAEWARSAGCAPAAALAIVVLAIGRGAISGGLSWRPLVWLGEASFAVYLVHWPLLAFAIPGGACGYFLAVLDVMALAHLLVEKPALAACMRLWRGLAPPRRVMPGQ